MWPMKRAIEKREREFEEKNSRTEIGHCKSERKERKQRSGKDNRVKVKENISDR